MCFYVTILNYIFSEIAVARQLTTTIIMFFNFPNKMVGLGWGLMQARSESPNGVGSGVRSRVRSEVIPGPFPQTFCIHLTDIMKI